MAKKEISCRWQVAFGRPCEEGVYLLTASYFDGGAHGIGGLIGRDHLVLWHPLVQAGDFDSGNVSVATATTAFMS